MRQVVSSYEEVREPYDSFYKLNIGQSLDKLTAKKALSEIYQEKSRTRRVYLLTTLLSEMMVKGPTVDEINGLLEATFELDGLFEETKHKIDLPRGEVLIGCAGSGKKGIKTFNISTPATIIAACCGAYIAKASSASTSSITGSSDFLSIIGVNINIPYEEKVNILKEKHIAFFSIENTTPKFAKLYEGTFYAPHAMSFALAGLSFPIKIDALVYGLAHPNITLSLDVLASNGFKDAVVYSSTEDGIHFIDEIGVSGFCNFIECKGGNKEAKRTIKVAEEVPIESQYTIKDIMPMKTPLDNVCIALKALQNTAHEAYVDAICINAGLFLYMARKTDCLASGYKMAKESVKSGRVFNFLLDIVRAYGGTEEKIINLLKDRKDI